MKHLKHCWRKHRNESNWTQEAERNAELLVAEEERIKKKAEKKRVKKKRQKDKKRQERHNLQVKAKGEENQSLDGQDQGMLDNGPPDSEESFTGATLGRSPSRSSEEQPEEELDLSSTFVSRARLKVSAKPLLPRMEKASKPSGRKMEVQEKPEIQSPEFQLTPVEQSMVLAECANEAAKQGRYHEATLLFTEALKLNPQEYRFFGNRSFCYEKLQQHPKALCDAQLALSLKPGWPKGFFRQGKALMGLKRYAEAARTFQELLTLGDFYGDAAVQLQKCQIQSFLENPLGCSPPGWSPLPAAGPLSLPEQHFPGSCDPAFTGSSRSPQGSSLLMPPAAKVADRERFAVWVGNLTPKVSPQALLQCFQPFGPIDSIRRLPQRFCAFVNYTSQEAAEAAYVALQGFEVEGCKLLLQLKHPAHASTGPSFVSAPARAASSTAQPQPFPQTAR